MIIAAPKQIKPYFYAAISLLVIGVSVDTAAEIYRVTDKDGNVTYTDKPSAGSTSENIHEEIKEAEQRNALPSLETERDNDPEWVKEKRKEREEKALANREANEKYKQALKDWRTAVAEAEKNLETAQDAAKSGQDIRETDLVGNVNGGVRPSEAYHKRQEKLKDKVEAAKKALKHIKKQKPKKPK
jgi:uncharacterized protein YukE